MLNGMLVVIARGQCFLVILVVISRGACGLRAWVERVVSYGRYVLRSAERSTLSVTRLVLLSQFSVNDVR